MCHGHRHRTHDHRSRASHAHAGQGRAPDPLVAEPLELRASDAERERVADALRGHAAAGRLDPAELDERVGGALTARSRAELAALVADLPGDAGPARARPAPAADRDGDARAFIPIAALLIVIWALTGMGYFWPVWPILGFVLVSLAHLGGARGNTRVIR